MTNFQLMNRVLGRFWMLFAMVKHWNYFDRLDSEYFHISTGKEGMNPFQNEQQTACLLGDV